MGARRTKKPVARTNINRTLKDIGGVSIRPLKEILDIAGRTNMEDSEKALKLIRTQIRARKIELDGVEEESNLDISLRISNEIAVLDDMRRKIENLQGFIGIYGSN